MDTILSVITVLLVAIAVPFWVRRLDQLERKINEIRHENLMLLESASEGRIHVTVVMPPFDESDQP